jgi:hypothetical protein
MIFAGDLYFVILFSFKLAARLIHMVVKDVFFNKKLQKLIDLTFLDQSGEIKVTVWSNLVEKWSGVLKVFFSNKKKFIVV